MGTEREVGCLQQEQWGQSSGWKETEQVHSRASGGLKSWEL